MAKTVTIYTDGACSGNPGVGGWGAVLRFNEHQKELAGYAKDTTNNRMEMFAVIQAVKELNQPCDLLIYSDSAYVCNAFNEGWVTSWIKNNWRTNSKTEVKNIDLWKLLLQVLEIHTFKFIKVKGHSDNELNNLCDKLATDQIKISKQYNSNN
ncbi:MAG: ribonuclease HI [Clostridia bacterium]